MKFIDHCEKGKKKRKPQIHENYAKVDLQQLIKECCLFGKDCFEV